jgi:hypothetical protein
LAAPKNQHISVATQYCLRRHTGLHSVNQRKINTVERINWQNIRLASEPITALLIGAESALFIALGRAALKNVLPFPSLISPGATITGRHNAVCMTDSHVGVVRCGWVERLSVAGLEIHLKLTRITATK